MARKTSKKPATDTAIIERIEDVDIAHVMRSSYSDYAAAVVIGRALPDVRDGLKPVHRRILWGMKESNYDWSGPFRKSARIVGDL
jgi:DNA gyrase subunit A